MGEWHAPRARGRIGELQPLRLRRALSSRLVIADRDERPIAQDAKADIGQEEDAQDELGF